jgi:hypothetical protein
MMVKAPSPILTYVLSGNNATLRLDLTPWPERRFRLTGRLIQGSGTPSISCNFNDVAADRTVARTVTNNTGVASQALTATLGSIRQQTTLDIKIGGKRNATASYPVAWLAMTCRESATVSAGAVACAHGAQIGAGTPLTSFSLVTLTDTFQSGARLELFDDGPV